MRLTKNQHKYIERLVKLGMPDVLAVMAAQNVPRRALPTRAEDYDLIICLFGWTQTEEGPEFWWGVDDCFKDLLRGAK